MSGLLIRTCAKVNLCLHVLERRADRYHEVQSVVQAIGLWDSIGLRAGGDENQIMLRVAGADVPEDETNTCWRAARLMAERAGARRGVTIELDKAIPVGAGLGGGSSDAAATLVGLARLWNVDVESAEMETIAGEIGADVPFFLRGGCCLATGKGEKLRSLPTVPMWLVVVVPEERVSTAEAYLSLGRGLVSAATPGLSRPVQGMVSALREGDPALIARALHNDFDAADLPGLAAARQAKADLLGAGCLGAGISGSGSAAFGIARDEPHAQTVAAELRRRWSWVQTARTLRPEEGMVVGGPASEGTP